MKKWCSGIFYSTGKFSWVTKFKIQAAEDHYENCFHDFPLSVFVALPTPTDHTCSDQLILVLNLDNYALWKLITFAWTCILRDGHHGFC